MSIRIVPAILAAAMSVAFGFPPANAPGRVKIAWEARNWGRDGAFWPARDSDSTESTSGHPRRAQRLPAGADLLAQTLASRPHCLQ
jgi:hypothetical protein